MERKLVIFYSWRRYSKRRRKNAKLESSARKLEGIQQEQSGRFQRGVWMLRLPADRNLVSSAPAHSSSQHLHVHKGNWLAKWDSLTCLECSARLWLPRLCKSTSALWLCDSEGSGPEAPKDRESFSSFPVWTTSNESIWEWLLSQFHLRRSWPKVRAPLFLVWEGSSL